MGITSKKQLAVALSRLLPFDNPKMRHEQYATDGEIAADALWNAYMDGDIEGKVVADFGCGTGILTVGALLLGAKHVYAIDKDADAFTVFFKNVRSLAQDAKDEKGLALRLLPLHMDVADFGQNVDVVIMNPPFGTKAKHADKEFLLRSFSCAPVVYSLHKSSTAKHIVAFAAEHGFRAIALRPYQMPLKSTMPHHAKRIERIDVSWIKFVKEE